MAELIPVDDPGDPRLDDFRDLAKADRRPDRPGGRGLVIAEGVVVVERLLASPYPVRSLLGVPARYEALAASLEAVETPYYQVSAHTMATVVGFHLNRGVLAVADRVPFPSALELARHSRVLAVLEGVADHENLGALFRNAAAFGVDAVILLDGCSDPLYRRSVRVSMGTVLRVPFALLPGPVASGLQSLRGLGLDIAALTPRADAVRLDDFATRRDASQPLAVLLGAEGPGLSEEALAHSDHRVRIPMVGGIDSLNVATAAAVAFAALTHLR